MPQALVPSGCRLYLIAMCRDQDTAGEIDDKTFGQRAQGRALAERPLLRRIIVPTHRENFFARGPQQLKHPTSADIAGVHDEIAVDRQLRDTPIHLPVRVRHQQYVQTRRRGFCSRFRAPLIHHAMLPQTPSFAAGHLQSTK